MNDLISRKYAIQQIQEGISENNGDFETDSAHVIDFLKVLPAVDAELVQYGHWETAFMSQVTGYDPTLANYIDTVFCHRCYICKEDARLDEFGKEILSKYCPNCGAKMWTE